MFFAIILGMFSLLTADGTSPHSGRIGLVPDWVRDQSQTAGSEQTAPANSQTKSPDPLPSPTLDPPSKSQGTSSATKVSASGAKSKVASAKRARPKKQSKKTNEADQSSSKVVVHNGGTVEPAVQLSPRVSNEQASSQRANTEGLLATSDSNLKQVTGRQLNPSQQETLTQIRSYMQQAKAANAAGDLERAHNLAFKARLLSDDLVSH